MQLADGWWAVVAVRPLGLGQASHQLQQNISSTAHWICNNIAIEMWSVSKVCLCMQLNQNAARSQHSQHPARHRSSSRRNSQPRELSYLGEELGSACKACGGTGSQARLEQDR
jgi:hypothetical protein